MRTFVLLTILLFTSLGYAQNTGSIVGKLTDKEFNNEPLAFANILIKGTTKGTTSDFDGLYSFENLDPGSYILVFSFVGYETQEISVEVVAGKVSEVNVPMGASAASLDEVVIKTTTRKESEAALLLDQKKAVEIKQSIGAEELSRKGVGDAAAAVSKISGVSKQQGSNNVYVRGLGDRYLNTTMNGLSLPSNDIAKKNIDLNLFSSDVIENVAVSKAYSSKFYGDFAAGNIDISSKEYTGDKFISVAINSGVNSRAAGESFLRNEGPNYFGYYGRYNHNPFAIILSNGVDPIDGESPINLGVSISGGKSFVFENNSKLSFFITGSFDNSFEYREGPIVDYTAAFNKDFPVATEYDYSTNTTLMGTVLYKINSDNKLKFTSLFINSSSDEVGLFGVTGNGFFQDSVNDIGFFQMNSQFNQDMIFVNQLIGEHSFDEKWDFDWGIGYNRVFAHEPDRKRFTLSNYQNLLDNDPNTTASFNQNNNFNNQRFFQNVYDEELNSRLSLSNKISETVKLNFGYNGKIRIRNFDNIRYGYKNINTTTNPITSIYNLNDIFNLQNFVDGVYETHVFNPIDPVRGLTQTNFPGLLETNYTGTLNVHAAYVSAEINLKDKWLIVPGLRIESFIQDIEYDAINLTSIDPGFIEASETFYLPSLNVKYALNDDQNLRFAFSKTISFPEFKEIAPFVYEDISNRIGGNQDLLGTASQSDKSYSDIFNVDLKYEWFMTKDEILSIGVFGKQINDPINLVLAADATGTQRYFRTGEKATVLGAEFELRKNILTSDDVSTLSAGLNVTYMHTDQDLYDVVDGDFGPTTIFNRDSDELEGASPLIVNADLNYKPNLSGNYKPSANLVFNYASDRIFSLGSGRVGNVIEKAVPSLDFILKNKIGEHTEINLSARNILDPKIEFIRENTGDGDVILSSFRRGINLGVQLKYNF